MTCFPFQAGSQSDAGRRSMPGLGPPNTSVVRRLGNEFLCWFRTKEHQPRPQKERQAWPTVRRQGERQPGWPLETLPGK